MTELTTAQKSELQLLQRNEAFARLMKLAEDWVKRAERDVLTEASEDDSNKATAALFKAQGARELLTLLLKATEASSD